MTEPTARPPRTGLSRTLTTPKIMFLVVAGAAPLAGTVGTLPLAYALGNGAGVPAAYLFASLTLLCFTVGYAALSRHVVNAGGFYAYLARGLGRPLAIGGGLIGVISYNAGTAGMVGATGYFLHLVGAAHGLHAPWEVWAGGTFAVMAVLGYREIELSARVLSLLTIGEIAILTVLDGSILTHRGAGALPLTSFAPHTASGPGLALGLMFAFMSFTGFESAALYGEESANPKQSVPRGTYAGITIIAGFFILTSWEAVGAVGPGRVAAQANADLGGFFFDVSDQYLGSAATTVMQVLLCTSLVGAVLAFHNAANRYMMALGRDGVLPRSLAAVHPRFGAPHRASMGQSTLTFVVCAGYAAAGLDPYVNLATTMLGLATLGIVLLQAGAAAAVIGYFRSRPDRHWWRTSLAPLLGAAGLLTTTVLLLRNFSLVAGTSALAVELLPGLMLLAVIAGFILGHRWRRTQPERYAALAGAVVDTDPDDRPRQVSESVGARSKPAA